MQIEALKDLIHQLNSEMFEASFGRRPERDSASISTNEFPVHESVCHLDPRFDNESLLEKLRDLVTNPNGQPRHIAVGHVIDEPSALQEVAQSVLVIGINYYQFPKTRYLGAKLCEQTNMRPKTQKVLRMGSVALQDRPLHLIASNIFPWVSTKPWTEFGLNAYREMALLEVYGYRDPLGSLTKVAKSLKESGILQGVIFHGIGSCVPYYAAAFARKWREGVPVFLSDNLAPAKGKDWGNFMRLTE